MQIQDLGIQHVDDADWNVTGIFIKDNGDSVTLAGQILTADMKADGYVLYKGEVPQGEKFKLVDGVLVAVAPDDLLERVKQYAYNMLNAAAAEYDYRSFDEVGSFMNSKVYAEEVTKLSKFRDDMWVAFYKLDTTKVISFEDAIKTLPVFKA